MYITLEHTFPTFNIIRIVLTNGLGLNLYASIIRFLYASNSSSSLDTPSGLSEPKPALSSLFVALETLFKI